MRPRRVLTVIAMSLLSAAMLLPGPAVLGQSPAAPGPTSGVTHRIAFDGFTFTFTKDIAQSVNVSTLTAGEPGGPTVPEPPSTMFSLYGATRSPRAGGGRGEIQLFRVSDLQADRSLSKSLRDLQSILDQRPDLDPTAEGSPQEIPLVIDFDAAQGIRVLATYVDTGEMTGVTFVTAFVQNTYPYTSDAFTAMFEGLSTDGSTAILATFPLTTTLFPKEVPTDLVARVSSNAGWQRYQRQALATLDEAGAAAFSPSLASISVLIASMAFEEP